MQKRQVMKKIVGRMLHRSLSFAMDLWGQNVQALQQEQAEEARRQDIMSRILKRILNQAQAAAFDRWREHAVELRRQQGIVEKVASRMRNATVYKAFARWGERAKEVRCARERDRDRDREIMTRAQWTVTKSMEMWKRICSERAMCARIDHITANAAKEVAEFRAVAVKHMDARYLLETEAQTLSSTLLRDLQRQQETLGKANARVQTLTDEVAHLKSRLKGCVCNERKGSATPRAMDVAESLKTELYERSCTTTGLRMRGVEVWEILGGSPAQKSGQIQVGDVVVSVDGRVADECNILALLLGCDTPGSTVDLTLRKKLTGVLVHVPMVRVCHKIHFSQRLGDNDLRIVVEQGHLNPPGVNDEPDFQQDPDFANNGIWRGVCVCVCKRIPTHPPTHPYTHTHTRARAHTHTHTHVYSTHGTKRR
jgi:hypothetical protein